MATNTKNLSLERVPPQNIDAEIAVLGSMLIEEEAITKAIELIDEKAFYKDGHRVIYRNIVELFGKKITDPYPDKGDDESLAKYRRTLAELEAALDEKLEEILQRVDAIQKI